MTASLFITVWLFLFGAWVCFYRREWLIRWSEPGLSPEERDARAAEPQVISHYRLGGAVLVAMPAIVAVLSILG